MPQEQEQRDRATQVADDRKATDEVSAEQQEWFRLAGLTRTEWQRLVFMRWLYRQGRVTDYPEGREPS